MSKKSILIIEDDADIVEILQFNLVREGYHCAVACDGETGLDEARRHPVELILLDLMLPKLDGLEVCRRLKQDHKTKDIPIIMLTAKSEESDIVLGLNLGADDYMTKPFSPKELLARVKAILRRASLVATQAPDSVVRIQNLVIDADKFEVTINNKPLPLTRSEFRILFALASQPGKVMTRDHLLDHACGSDVTVIDRNVDVHIASLRKKLADYASHIITVRGIGYRFREAV